MSSPYTVNLVSPGVSTKVDRGNDTEKTEDVEKERRETSLPSDVPRKTKKDALKERDLVAKRIDALRQKESLKEKLNAIKGKEDEILKLAKHRKIVSLTAGNEKGDGDSKKRSVDYSSKIMDGIQPYWALPPGIEKKGLEAVVSIKILKDGTVIVQGIEKRSGNRLFDRSALQALAKASPLPRPPYEMEIGVKFHP
jgi:TolA protein